MAGARVLVVEDAEAIRVAVETGLLGAGYVVLGRSDGRVLERDLTVFRPDVVVLDVMLPGRDGFALLEVVRRVSTAVGTGVHRRGRLAGDRGDAAGRVRFALAPLDAMTALARRIAGGGRGSRLSSARTDTELGRTAAAFDVMLDALEALRRRRGPPRNGPAVSWPTPPTSCAPRSLRPPRRCCSRSRVAMSSDASGWSCCWCANPTGPPGLSTIWSTSPASMPALNCSGSRSISASLCRAHASATRDTVIPRRPHRARRAPGIQNPPRSGVTAKLSGRGEDPCRRRRGCCL